MKVRKSVLVITLMFVCLWANAQQIEVLDANSLKPLEMVSIFSKDPRHIQFTDIEGKAKPFGFKNAETIEFRLLGYLPVMISYDSLAQSGFRVTMTPSQLSLEQIVVSAIRWRQKTNEIPGKITGITSSDVSFQNPQTAADMLNISGEVFIQKSQQGGGSPMIRGFSTNRILLSVDGIRMNTAIFRSGNVHNVISLDPFSIEQTEILFGPGSVMYGSDAIGGVMRFNTKNARLSRDEEFRVDASYSGRYASANNEITNHLEFNMGWKKWAALTSITFTEYGDLRMGLHGPDENYTRTFKVERLGNQDIMVNTRDPLIQDPTGYNQLNVMQKVRYAYIDWDVQYAFHFSESSSFSRYDRLTEMAGDLPRSAEWMYGPQVWTMNHLDIKHRKKTVLYDEMSISLAHQFFEESRIDRRFNRNIRSTRTEKVNAYSANIDLQKKLTFKQQINYGVEYVYNDVASFGEGLDIVTGETPNISARYPQSNWASAAVFLTHQYNFSRNWHWQSGIRYNQFILRADFSNNENFIMDLSQATINQGAVSGSTGLVYNVSKKLFFRGNLSSGFRAPNIDDIGKVFDSEPGSVVLPNPNVGAEYAYNAELGMAALIGSSVKFDLSVFYTYLDNALVRRDFQINGEDSIIYDGVPSRIQAIQNAAHAQVYGMQSFLEIKLSNRWALSSTFNYQNGHEEMDDGTVSRSRHAAPWFGISRLNYNKSKWTYQLYTMYSGAISHENMPVEEVSKTYMYAVDENGNAYAPGWFTVNMKAQYALSKQFTFMAGIENITNRRYRPFSSGLVAPGRNFIFSIRAKL